MIRPATAADCPALAAIAQAAYARYVERIGQRPPPMDADFAMRVAAGEVDVATRDDDAVCGYVVWRVKPDHVFIENVAVDPACAGRGIGRRLLAHVEERAIEAGHDALRLYTNLHMTENLAIYPRLGWVETDRRREDGFDRVFFRKVLTRTA